MTPEYTFDFSVPGRLITFSNGTANEASVPSDVLGYVVNDSEIANRFDAAIDPVLADAIDVALAAHLADRLALRHRNLGKTRPELHRTIGIQLAVRKPEVWMHPKIQSALETALGYLTQDTWGWIFQKRLFGRISDSQQRLFGPRIPDSCDVGLFSGGLDSLAGTAAEFAQPDVRHLICVSASPSNIQKGLQRRQFQGLRSFFKRNATHICVQYSLQRSNELLQEPSRRTRGLLFLLIGAAVAVSAAVDRLHVYENGFGAINLPYDLSQIGIDNTRSMHPRNLRNIANLVSELLGRPFVIENRSFFRTKAQLCGDEGLRQVPHLIRESFSCDGFTRKGEHCGYCTSCLLRRVALYAAGLGHLDNTNYLNDCISPEWHPKQRQLRGLFAMTWQAARLKSCLAAPYQWRRLLQEFPELHAVAQEAAIMHTGRDVCSDLIRLYRDHVNDWLNFPALRHLPTRVAA